jgi:hypothetical protein
MSITSSDSSKNEKTAWGYSPFLSGRSSFKQEDFQNMAGFEAAARNFYQHGMAVFNPEKEKYIFCKAGSAAFLMASGSIVPHLFEAPERTEIVDLAREYHGETETFANLSSMFITKQDDLEGAESDDEAAATQPKAKIPLIDQCLALTKIARDSNVDSESLADVFAKRSKIHPDLATALADFREQQNVVLTTLYNGITSSKSTADDLVKAKAKLAFEAVEKMCTDGIEGSPQIYNTYDCHPKVAYFLSDLQEKLRGRMLKDRGLTTKFDEIWNVKLDSWDDLQKFVTHAESNILNYQQSYQSVYPLPRDGIMVCHYLSKMESSGNHEIQTLALQVTEIFKTAEDADEAITFQNFIAHLVTRLPVGAGSRSSKRAKLKSTNSGDQHDGGGGSAIANYAESGSSYNHGENRSSNERKGYKIKGSFKGKGDKESKRNRQRISQGQQNDHGDKASDSGHYGPISKSQGHNSSKPRCKICKLTNHSTEQHVYKSARPDRPSSSSKPDSTKGAGAGAQSKRSSSK